MEKDNDGLLLRPILPPDIVIKTAFFISDWPTLIKFLISLRPADNLGPLEHLLQLRWLGRPGPSLWPQLGVLWSNEKEREHLEQIAKYYSRIVVNPCQVDPEWLGQFSTERASVSWIGSPHEELKDAVVKVSSREFYCKWAQYCVAGFEFYGHFLDNSIEVLDHMNNLVEVSAVRCSQTVFSAVAAFAGRSRSLRVLILSTIHGGLTLFCTLTEDMVENLVQWITSQSIQGVHLTGFVCENDDLRSKLTLALVKSTSLEQLTMKKMNLNLVPLIPLNAPKLRYLNLNDCFLEIQDLALRLLESNIEVLSLSKNYQESSLESLFEVLPRTKITSLYLPGCITNGNVKFWQEVVPFLKLSHLKTLNLNRNNIGNAEAIVLADGIRDHKTLQTLHLSFNNFEYDGAISLLQAASPSFKKIYLGRTWKKKCTQEERDELETLAEEKKIQLCE